MFDVGTLDLMLSDAYYPAFKLMADHGYTIDWGNYLPGIATYYASSKGQMFSFPFNSSTALLYWNKDAFAKIGKTEAPKTWEEAEADMKALKAAGYDCPMAIDISESLDQSHTHCPPCPELVSTYEKKSLLGREVLLSRSPSEESRSRIVAYFWLRDVFVTLVIRHENVAIARPSLDELEAEILRIAESMIGKPT